jgi:hypothetical protein
VYLLLNRRFFCLVEVLPVIHRHRHRRLRTLTTLPSTVQEELAEAWPAVSDSAARNAL